MEEVEPGYLDLKSCVDTAKGRFEGGGLEVLVNNGLLLQHLETRQPLLSVFGRQALLVTVTLIIF